MVARCCWLTPIILADMEAEIRRIPHAGQPRKKFARLHLNVKKLGAVSYTCQLGYDGKHKKRQQFRSNSKIATARICEAWFNWNSTYKHKTLRSSPSTSRNKNEKVTYQTGCTLVLMSIGPAEDG
jgi:hypothetical protein